jgi:hypothetical protein
MRHGPRGTGRALALVAVLLPLVALPACGTLQNYGITRTARSEAPLPYRTRMTRGEDRRDIAVTVESRGDGLAEVREAVRFEATRYCLTTWGGSEADWQIDPATGDWAFSGDGTQLTFRARCVANG